MRVTRCWQGAMALGFALLGFAGLRSRKAGASMLAF